jgi:cytochrome c peroxidase
MKKITFLAFFALGLLVACRQNVEIGPLSPIETAGRLDNIPYQPISYNISPPQGLPIMEIPADNPLTIAGIKLGRTLFYDKILSADSTMSCASCHQINKAFTDGLATSVGIRGLAGHRNAMSLINIGYFWKQNRVNNFNWDGKFATIEEQVLAPVEHPLELDADWDIITEKFRNHPHYPKLFRKAFGINNLTEINKELAAKALAQFLRTLVSAGSEFDRSQWQPLVFLSDEAQRGYEMFIGDANGSSLLKDAECAHCHSSNRSRALFARNGFSNNGLDSAASLTNFTDLGLGAINGISRDNGKFREVSLRNIALTAPYMHDGRFQTIEQVLNNYTTGGHPAPNLAIELSASGTIRTLNVQEKADIIAFLHTLTDSSYFSKTEWQNPFEVENNPWD